METLTINKGEIEKECIRLKVVGDTIGILTDEDMGYDEEIRQGIKEILLNIVCDIEKTEDPGEIKRQLNKAKVVEYLFHVDVEVEEEGTNEMNITRWGLNNVVERTVSRIEELITGKPGEGV